MRRRLLAVVSALLLGLLLGGGAGTYALFTDTGTVSAGAVSTGTLGRPQAPTVTAPTLTTTRITWTGTTVDTGAGTTPATGYRVLRYAGAQGGTGTQVCPATAGDTLPSGTTTCTVTSQLGAYYSVVATFRGAWAEEGPRATLLQTISFTAPTNGTSTDAATLRTEVQTRCGSSAVACGTIANGVAVQSVDYLLERSQGLLSTSCWDGSTWPACPVVRTYRSANPTSANGTTSWSVPGQALVAFPNGNGGRGTYTLTIRLTQVGGAVSSSSITFTIT